MSKPVIIIGAGGHGKVVADALAAMGRDIRGFLDADAARWGNTVNGIQVLGDDGMLDPRDSEEVELANGVGSARSMEMRKAVFERSRAMGFRFVTVVHPSAVVSPSAQIREGAQIMAGAVVQPDAVIGEDTVLNNGAIVDHGCLIGAHCHVAPGCALSGNVTIGDASHIGVGATVKQGVRLGSGTLVGAGAVVILDHEGGTALTGVPAKASS